MDIQQIKSEVERQMRELLSRGLYPATAFIAADIFETIRKAFVEQIKQQYVEIANTPMMLEMANKLRTANPDMLRVSIGAVSIIEDQMIPNGSILVRAYDCYSQIREHEAIN